MNFYTLLDLVAMAAFVVLLLSLLGLVLLLFLYLAKRRKTQRLQTKRSKPAQRLPPPASSSGFLPFSSSDEDDDEPDITIFPVQDIPRSGLFSASERRMEYRRRGKSPSGVIDGVYNDSYRENGRPYNDMDRDWDADA